MNKKLCLTSIIALVFAFPAIAEPSNTGEFPTGGLMQEDYTYTNAATSTNMDGVYEGSVNATAQYTDILYQLAVGQYLPAGAESPVACNQPGYYCPGDANGVYYNANASQGLTSCSTVGDGAYTLSDGTGSTADSCYATGSANCATRNPYLLGHASNVTYGNSTNGSASCKTYYGDPTTCVLDNSNACEITGLTCQNGYTATTFGLWSQDNMGMIMSNIGNGHGCTPGGYCNSNDGNFANGEMFSQITNAPGFQYDSFTVSLACSDISADTTDPTTMVRSTSEITQGETSGVYCWMRFSKIDNIDISEAKWFYYDSYSSVQECGNECGYVSYVDHLDNIMIAAQNASNSIDFCAPNVISINWSDVDPEFAGYNDEDTAIYGGDIHTPVKAATKPGKRFSGWVFSAPETASVEPESDE